jgi:lipopolysaccharide export LptBFGC system permease protein LptF
MKIIITIEINNGDVQITTRKVQQKDSNTETKEEKKEEDSLEEKLKKSIEMVQKKKEKDNKKSKEDEPATDKQLQKIDEMIKEAAQLYNVTPEQMTVALKYNPLLKHTKKEASQLISKISKIIRVGKGEQLAIE